MQSKRALVLFCFAAFLFSALARAAWQRPLAGPLSRGAVASDMAAASRAGAEILAKGGNAVDAAVATALALGVVNPASSGLGGGGFAVLYRAKDRSAHALDFRETAPRAATADMYVRDGRAVPALSRAGGLAVAVPGEPAGLAELHRRHGKLALSQVVQPAARLARDGFQATPYLAEAAERTLRTVAIKPGDPIRALLEPGGRALTAGTRVRRPELARTLIAFGARGASALSSGRIAQDLVEAARRSGGILTAEDIAAYKPLWRTPLEGRFRGHVVYGAPPPAGGLTALEALQILDARPPAPGPGSSAQYHLLAEAFKHAFADRARVLGDPAFVDVPTARLADPAYARELAARIDAGRVLKPEAYGTKDLVGAPAQAPAGGGTSHLCAADGEGNVVALTTTVNLQFGAAVLAPRSGVVLNDEMDDFSAQPAAPNAFGLIGGFANAIAPGKRPVSSMSPTVVVKDGRPVICAGASGGPTIVTSTVQAIVNVLDHGYDAQAAISAPRVHAQWMPDQLFVEDEVPLDVVDNLRKLGHVVSTPRDRGAAQILVFKGDRVEAASDPRKGGAPAVPELN